MDNRLGQGTTWGWKWVCLLPAKDKSICPLNHASDSVRMSGQGLQAAEGGQVPDSDGPVMRPAGQTAVSEDCQWPHSATMT